MRLRRRRPPGPAQEAVGLPLLRGFVRGVGWTYLSLLVNGVAVLCIVGWSVRRLGTAEYGVYALAVSICDVVTLFDGGLGISVIHGVARSGSPDPDERAAGRSLVSAAHGAYAFLGAVLLAVTAVAVVVVGGTGLGPARHAVLAVALMGSATAISLATAALPAVAVGCRRFSARSGAAVVGACVRVAVALPTVGDLGIAGLAAAQLAGVLAERIVLVCIERRVAPWFRFRPGRPTAADLRRVTSFALPLFVLSLSAQLFEVSDLVTVGVLVGTAAVAVYQVGGLLPLQARVVLLSGYGVVYPALAGADDRRAQEDATAFLTRAFAFVAGLGFMLGALLRHDLVLLLLGRVSRLGETVLVIFCAAGLADMLVHGSATLLVARGAQSVMARAVAIELPMNLVLSVVLVLALGASGAAWATLVTVLVMDLVVFPRVSRGHFSQPFLELLARHALAPLGLAAVVVVTCVAATAPLGRAVRLPSAVAGVTILGGIAGFVFLGRAGRDRLRSALGRHDLGHDPSTASPSVV